MNYLIVASLTRPKAGKEALVRDVPKNKEMSDKDKHTIGFAYPKPIGAGGGYLEFNGQVSCRYGYSYPAPQFAVPRIIIGIGRLNWRMTRGSGFVRAYGCNATETDFNVAYQAKGLRSKWKTQILVIDPLIRQIVVPREPFTAEREDREYGRGCTVRTLIRKEMGDLIPDEMDIDSDPEYAYRPEKDDSEPSDDEEETPDITAAHQLLNYPGQLNNNRPTLIFWINDLSIDRMDVPGSVRINRPALWSSAGHAKAIKVSKGCLHKVGYNWFGFSQDALNICGGTMSWRPTRRGKKLITVPRERFPSHEKITVYAAVSELDLRRGFCKSGSLSFRIIVHQEPTVHPTELHYTWEVKCCHTDCVRHLSFDWVAVTERYPMPEEDKQWLRDRREQERQDELAAEASRRKRQDSMEID